MGISCLYFSSARIKGGPPSQSNFYVSSKDLNCGLHTCVANTLSPEPALQPLQALFPWNNQLDTIAVSALCNMNKYSVVFMVNAQASCWVHTAKVISLQSWAGDVWVIFPGGG